MNTNDRGEETLKLLEGPKSPSTEKPVQEARVHPFYLSELDRGLFSLLNSAKILNKKKSKYDTLEEK